MAALNGLLKLSRSLVFVLTGLVVVACVAMFATRLQVNEQIRRTIEQVASENAGLAIEVGQVRGTWWSGLTLHDVKVHGTPDRSSEVVIAAPLIQASYTLTSFFGARPAPIRLDVYHPDVSFRIGGDRLTNIQPRIRTVHDDPPAEPGPPVDLVFHGGHLSYADATARRPFKVEVGRLTGTGTLRGFELKLALQAMRDADVLRAGISYDLAAMRGELDLTADGLDLPYWVNRFGWAPEYELMEGEADLVAHASWRDPFMLDELKLGGRATMRGGKVWLKNVHVPLENVVGSFEFDERAARLSGVTGTLAGMPIAVSGEVADLTAPAPYLGYPDQRYALTVTAPAIDLAKLAIPWPGLARLGLAGMGRIDARVTGTALAPVVDMVGKVPVGRWGKETLEDVVIDGRYVTGRLDLPSFRGRVAGGTLRGTTFVGLPPGENDPVPYRVAIAFDGLRLPVLLEHYLEEPLIFAVDGRVHGDYVLEGVSGKNRARVRARVAQGTIDGRPVERCTLSWIADGPRWRIPDGTLDWGRTHADVTVEGSEAGPFTLRFKLPRGDIAWLMDLNPDPPETPVRGNVVGEGWIRGMLDFPKSWTGKMAFHVAEAHVWNERFDRGEAELHLADNMLVIDRAVGRFLGGKLSTTGTYGPFVAKRTVEAFTRLDVRFHEWELGAVSALPPALRDLRGRVQGRLAYVGRRRHYDATGDVTAMRVRHPDWGELERVRASVIMTPTEVSLLPATWTQKGETIRISGHIGVPPTDSKRPPTLDLRVKADRVDVPTLLDAMRWRRMLERLAPQAARSVPALGPERPAAELPGRGDRPLREALTALGEQLAHWQTHRKAPLVRAPSTPAALPFWEGSAGKVTLDARLTGPATAPRAEVELQLDGLRLLGRQLDQLEARFVATRDRLGIAMARLREAGRSVLTVGGSLTDGPRDTLVVRAHGLDLGWLERLLAPRGVKLSGRAEGLVRLRGPWAAPRVEVDGALVAGRFEMPGLTPLAFDQVQADMAFERGRLWIDRATLRQAGREASLAGSVPIDDRAQGPAAKVDLALKLQDGNLGIVNLFAQDRFRWLDGKGVVELKLGGTMAHPSLAGKVDIRDGRFEAKGLDGPVEEFEADVALDDAKVAIRALKGRYGGGGFELQGDAFWEAFEPRRVDLTAVARPFRVRTPDGTYNGMLEANLKLAGPVSAPVLSGQVGLWDGVIRIRDQIARDTEAPAPPPLRLSGLNIVLGPGLYVRNALMDVSITTLQRQGHLHVDGTLAAPKPRGVVIVESGTITPLNNPFKIVEGRVEFLGENVGGEDVLSDILGTDVAGPRTGLNGRLDVQARSSVYDYGENETVDLTAHVTGTLDRMEMRFSALPIRSEQEILDILSKKQVLAGTFSGKLAGSDVIVKEVGGFVTSNIEELVSPITLRLRNMLNLQTLRFELVSNWEKTSMLDLAGFRPALTLETRPLFERLSLGSRLVAGELYDTSPNTGNDNNYVGMNFRLNRRLALEYRIDPYVDPKNQRVLNQTLGLRAQMGF